MADDTLRQKVESVGIPTIRRNIFLCADQTKPKCCDKERGLAAWEYLRTRLSQVISAPTTSDSPRRRAWAWARTTP